MTNEEWTELSISLLSEYKKIDEMSENVATKAAQLVILSLAKVCQKMSVKTKIDEAA